MASEASKRSGVVLALLGLSAVVYSVCTINRWGIKRSDAEDSRLVTKAFFRSLVRHCIRLGDRIRVDDDYRPIENLESLKARLPAICSAIHQLVGTRQLEKTYQSILKLELEKRGVLVLDEVSIPLMYAGSKVGTRRVDLALKLASNEQVLLELKALSNVTAENRKQLKFYMKHMDVTHGMLINFPHQSGFPEVDASFIEEVICGDDLSNSRSSRPRKMAESVEIVYVQKTTAVGDK